MKRKIRYCTRVLICMMLGFFVAVSTVSAQNFTDLSDPTIEENEVHGATPNDNKLIKEMPITPYNMLLQDHAKYTLGVTDVIEVLVMRHPEVSGEYIVNNEGKIQFEFIGDIKVIGLTKDEVREKLQEHLSEYIIDPDVNIKITGYNSKAVYVIGEVAAPGKIFMKGDTITVHEALVQAGLPLLSASTKKCRLITPTKDGNPQLKYVDVFSLLYDGDLRENLIMKPGDTLYIPATVLSKAMRVISPVTQPVAAVGSAGVGF